MIRAKQTLTGSINNAIIKEYPKLEDLYIVPSLEKQQFKSKLYGYNNVTVEAIIIKERYLEGKNLVLVFPDGSKLYIDLSLYINNELTEEQIEAINSMTISIENDELIIEYDETVLDLDFLIEDNNLMVTNNVTGIDFNINNNGELEVSY